MKTNFKCASLQIKHIRWHPYTDVQWSRATGNTPVVWPGHQSSSLCERCDWSFANVSHSWSLLGRTVCHKTPAIHTSFWQSTMNNFSLFIINPIKTYTTNS